jgi:hypothetical protein
MSNKIGGFLFVARARGLGQGHLSFLFSKNHRPAREAGKASGQKGGGLSLSVIPTRNFCPSAVSGWWVGVRRLWRRTSQSEFCSKKVRTSSSNCDKLYITLN